MYIIYIYIHLTSSPWTPVEPNPPQKKNQWKKPSLKNLPPAFTTRHRPDGREGHHGDAPKIVGTPWSLRPREGGWVRRAEKCSSKGKVGETLGRVQKRYIPTYERPPKPPTIRNSYTRTLILDMIMKPSGTIGVTQKTRTFDIHVCLILNLKTFIQQVNIGMKSSLQEHPEAVCQK